MIITQTHMHTSLLDVSLQGRHMLCYYLVSHTQGESVGEGYCHYLQSNREDKKGKFVKVDTD